MTTALRLPDFRFTKTTLANGLDVIVRREDRLPVVAVNLWYHVGSKNEERRQRGFAHLFEHLMFEGSEHYPGDFFKPLQRLGAAVNGSTSSDRTNYFTDTPSAHVELALAMESDRMGHLIPAPRRPQAPGPEGRGQERVPPELRQPPLRHGLAAHLRGPLSPRPPL